MAGAVTLAVALGVAADITAVSGENATSPKTRPAGQPTESIDLALILPIRDVITDITYESIKRRLKQREEDDIRLVIFEMDTPGGALDATLEICNEIKALRDDGIKTYAWINRDAYSAGTIIALATDGIVMARNATIGDCQPITISPSGPAAVPEEVEAKMTSPLLAELYDSIRRNGYDRTLVMALIRPGVEVFWVENTQTGERKFVEAHERNQLFGINPDEPKSGLLRFFTTKSNQKKLVEPVPDSESKLWKYVRKVDDLEIRQPIDSETELLTMRSDVAKAYGFSMATLANEDQIRDHFNITGSLRRAENTWVEDGIEWMASPTVRAILFLLMLLGAYVEMHTPGFGLAGSVSLVCLVLFLGAPYLAGFTVTWEIVAILTGIILLAVEAFVLPGFGVAGILGIIILLVGLLSSFVPTEPGFDGWPRLPTMQLSYDYLKLGVYSLASGLGGSIVCMVLLAKYLPNMPMARRLIPANPTREAVLMPDPYREAAKIGDIGRSESLLRPAGKARFGATLVDVVSEGEYIAKGERVEVVQRAGNRVVVRRAEHS